MERKEFYLQRGTWRVSNNHCLLWSLLKHSACHHTSSGGMTRTPPLDRAACHGCGAAEKRRSSRARPPAVRASAHRATAEIHPCHRRTEAHVSSGVARARPGTCISSSWRTVPGTLWVMRQLQHDRAQEWAHARRTTIGESCRAIFRKTLGKTIA